MRTPAIAIAVRALVRVASRPHRAVRTAMAALPATDHADRVRATRSVGTWLRPASTRQRLGGRRPTRATSPSGEHDLVLSEQQGGGFLELARVRHSDEGSHGIEIHADRP